MLSKRELAELRAECAFNEVTRGRIQWKEELPEVWKKVLIDIFVLIFAYPTKMADDALLEINELLHKEPEGISLRFSRVGPGIRIEELQGGVWHDRTRDTLDKLHDA